MAGVQYGPIMKPSTNKPQKRSFAADITNQNTTTGQPKKPKQEPPKKKQYVGGWSETDLSSSEPHSDATEESEVARRTYGMRAVLQRRHAPQISKDTEYYDHVEPNAAKAAKARQSGGTVTFVATSEQPLEQMPLDGGVSHTSHVPEISPDVVGVSKIGLQRAKVGNKTKARKKKTRKGQGAAGVTRAPPFSVWFDGELVGKYEGKWKDALPDIRQKRPGKFLTQDMLQCLLGIKKRELMRKKRYLEQQLKDSKFTAEYDT